MANESNLRPQKAGEPGHNPKGRGKGVKNWKTIYEEVLSMEMKAKDSGFEIPFVKDQNSKLTLQHMIALRQVKKALGKCDHQDIKLMQDRTEGLLSQPIENKVDLNIEDLGKQNKKDLAKIKEELLELIKGDLKDGKK